MAPLLQRYVRVKIDVTAPTPPAKALMERFGVVGLPTLLVLDPTGAERTDLRVVGGIDPAGLAKRLRDGLRR